MMDLLNDETDEEIELVEISDAEGNRAEMRRLATVEYSGKLHSWTYHHMAHRDRRVYPDSGTRAGIGYPPRQPCAQGRRTTECHRFRA